MARKTDRWTANRKVCWAGAAYERQSGGLTPAPPGACAGATVAEGFKNFTSLPNIHRACARIAFGVANMSRNSGIRSRCVGVSSAAAISGCSQNAAQYAVFDFAVVE